jgi:uncharacterized membrane protein (DUF2068 family)
MNTHRPRGLVAAITYLAVAAVGTTAYWLVFFTSGAVHVQRDAAYLAFEKAFPLADGWMAACAVLGAVGLWRGRPWGLLFGLLAASSLVFLGCMDVLWNLNSGSYAIGNNAMKAEIAINVFCLAGGSLLILYLWRHRRSLA